MIKISDFLESPNVFGDIRKYFAYNLSQAPANGSIVECGVFKGTTINHIADMVAPKPVYGFDSFKGLPEMWELSEGTVIEEGCFATTELPKVKKNVELIEGLFKDSLPNWTSSHTEPISFLHLDCDIYSSTLDALTLLNHLLKANSIIVFDDMYSWQDEEDYSFWRRGQWKALREWMKDYSRDVEAVSRMRRRNSCAVRVIQ